MASSNQWTAEEENMFEFALAIYTEESPNRWEEIASAIDKTVEEVKKHYPDLFSDVPMIENGLDDQLSNVDIPVTGLDSVHPISSLPSKQEDNKLKRKRTENSWTEDEHRLFLIGLKKYDKGDWRSISRNVVMTKTSTQVASHAQKYYLRQNSEKKRYSIHDLTLEGSTLAAPISNIASPGQQETLTPTPTPTPTSTSIPIPTPIPTPISTISIPILRQLQQPHYQQTPTPRQLQQPRHQETPPTLRQLQHVDSAPTLSLFPTPTLTPILRQLQQPRFQETPTLTPTLRQLQQPQHQETRTPTLTLFATSTRTPILRQLQQPRYQETPTLTPILTPAPRQLQQPQHQETPTLTSTPRQLQQPLYIRRF